MAAFTFCACLLLLTAVTATGTQGNGADGKHSFCHPAGKCGYEALIPSPFVHWGYPVMQSVGRASFPVILIDFQDVTYRSNRLSESEVEERLFHAPDGVSAYYETASYGNLHLDGCVYHYTAQGNIGDYETGNSSDEECSKGYEKLGMEALSYLSETVDFTQFDQNRDGVLDSLVLCVPNGGDYDFWYGCEISWYQNPDFTVDGLSVGNYVINDEQPYRSSMRYFIDTVEHELGHCMGLPDYYKYNSADSEGMHGAAGYERMDDSTGDFCMFSKIQLGWLTPAQIQFFPENVQEKTFLLPSVADGGCIAILPPGARLRDYQNECFIIEYDTPEGNLSDALARTGGGVRILHGQAQELIYADGVDYLYENFSDYYDPSDEGIRFIRLVNDGNGFYQTGDVIAYGTSYFGWYVESEEPFEERGPLEMTDPGFTISIGEETADGIYITISRCE